MPPSLGLTLGDPAGIGPEVVEGALRHCLPLAGGLRPILFGPRGLADALAARLGGGVQSRCQAPFTGPLGQASAASGAAALAALQAAIGAAQAGELAGLVTAPISKHALHLAGSSHLGHTGLLAERLGGGPCAMAFLSPRLRVVLVSVHEALQAAVAGLSSERVVQVATLMDALLRTRLGIDAPRLGLAGLNPHAGEGGLMGDEEGRILAPAVARLRAAGIDISAPQSPDTVFRQAVDGHYDAVVALYHDQGLIPIKLLSFGEAVNVTLGLRVVRTSPDHGTAYALAGQGTARPEGFTAALQAACLLVGGAR